jgi:hypothetical protein
MVGVKNRQQAFRFPQHDEPPQGKPCGILCFAFV